jgi:hypothetical protein
MVKYIIIHNTHNGCYDFQYYEDEATRLRLTSITINPPKVFLFNTREEAQDFFEEYMNDVDCIDNRCKKGNDIVHMDYCTCGIIEMDEDDNPILFYNKKNQIFLLEQGAQVFQPTQELKNDVKNLNLTNNIMRKCKNLNKEQRKRYIDLGKYCEDCNIKDANEEQPEQKQEQPEQKQEQPEQKQEQPEQKQEQPEQKKKIKKIRKIKDVKEEQPEQKKESPEQKEEQPEQKEEQPEQKKKIKKIKK